MTATQRLEAVIAGRLPDRPPFSFWYHFHADQFSGRAAVTAHMEHLDRYDMDFLKVMNDNPYPQKEPIRSVKELHSLPDLAGTEEGFGLQLKLIASLKSAVRGNVPLITTIFNPWATLRNLVQPPHEHLPPNMDASADAPSRWIRDAYAQEPDAVRHAINTIARNLSHFAAQCLSAGADGIFLSVRDDWVDTPQRPHLYDDLVRAADLQVLAGASQARFNILHVCGKAIDFPAFAAYPVSIINWADRAAGPAIRHVAGSIKPAICGGVDNNSTLITGTPEAVAREVEDAIAQAHPHPLIIAPGCTFSPDSVPPANLKALVNAVKSAHYAQPA